MAICKTCGRPFDWGNLDGRWVLLEPLDSDRGLDRTFVDETGTLRADHRDTHHGGGTVNVVRLEKKVRAEELGEGPAVDYNERCDRYGAVAS